MLTRQSLLEILGPTAAKDPEVRKALRGQLAYELEQESGLSPLVARYLSDNDIRHVISSMERFRSQYPQVEPLEPEVQTQQSKEPPPDFAASMDPSAMAESGGLP